MGSENAFGQGELELEPVSGCSSTYTDQNSAPAPSRAHLASSLELSWSKSLRAQAFMEMATSTDSVPHIADSPITRTLAVAGHLGGQTIVVVDCGRPSVHACRWLKPGLNAV